MPTQKIELGWMNITPCTRIRMETINGPLGIKFDVPRVDTAEQRLYGYVDIDSPNWNDEATSAAKVCVVAAVGAAGGIGAITANPGAAAVAFGQAFLACFSAKMADVSISSLHLETSSQCMW